MNTTTVVSRLREVLGERLVAVHEKSSRRTYVDVVPSVVPEVARTMLGELGARFQIATGIDTLDHIEILYHWALDATGTVVTVRVRLDRAAPVVESIVSICPAAEWIEREIWELLGVDFRHHPDLRHLLLRDDWPQGEYPLRRDYRR